jgi:hypothetical protein
VGRSEARRGRSEARRAMFRQQGLTYLAVQDTHEAAIRELTKVALVNHYTIIVAWR